MKVLGLNLLKLMQIIMFDDRNKPKTLKKAITRHKTSPPIQRTVAAQPTSSGIKKKVTKRSAMARWIRSRSMRA